MMNLEVTMPVSTRRRYTEEFKREAVRLVREFAHRVIQEREHNRRYPIRLI